MSNATDNEEILNRMVPGSPDQLYAYDHNAMGDLDLERVRQQTQNELGLHEGAYQQLNLHNHPVSLGEEFEVKRPQFVKQKLTSVIFSGLAQPNGTPNYDSIKVPESVKYIAFLPSLSNNNAGDSITVTTSPFKPALTLTGDWKTIQNNVDIATLPTASAEWFIIPKPEGLREFYVFSSGISTALTIQFFSGDISVSDLTI